MYSIILPCYNERDNLKLLIIEIKNILKNINFFKSDHLLINFIKENSLKNHNSLWGLYAMAKWFESLNLNL